jgi:hypothetical protein
MLTFFIIIIAAIISIAIISYCHDAVSSFNDTVHNTNSCTTEESVNAAQIVKNEMIQENINNQQILVFPFQQLGELKVF